MEACKLKSGQVCLQSLRLLRSVSGRAPDSPPAYEDHEYNGLDRLHHRPQSSPVVVSVEAVVDNHLSLPGPVVIRELGEVVEGFHR